MAVTFSLISVATLPWWLSMLLFPRTPSTRTLVTSPWPFVGLAGAYAVLLAATLVAGSAPPSLDPRALADAMGRPLGFLTAWAHMVTLDLFAGVWIFRDARFYGRLPRTELILTWVAGPLGLGLYLWRRRGWSASAARTVN